jgi:four helix bundle protein
MDQTQQLKDRYKKLGIAVILMVRNLPAKQEFRLLGSQLIRSATSPGANYRAACRAKSAKDFLNKIKIVEEELDETLYWLEIIAELHPDAKAALTPLWKEANELLAIVVATLKKLRTNEQK